MTDSTALVRRHVELPAEVLSDDEIRRLYRLAESMHGAGMYDDIKKPEQAFVKMLLGKDLGLSPTQALGGLHLVKGNVQVHYAMLARFINARAEEGYSYRPGWIKQNPVPEGEEATDHREAVWFDEDDPVDMRDIVGAFVQFSIGGQQVGVSRYTIEDAEKANLLSSDAKAAWNTSRRNMLLARAMSNGVKWMVPEVMGGLPIYVQGEIVDDKPSVTEPVGDGEGQGIDLGPKVDAIIERATELGHRGLSDRPRLELLLGKRAPGVVNKFVEDAKVELDRFAAEQAEAEKDAPPPEGEIPEAEVVEGEPEAEAAERPTAAEEMQITVLRNRRKTLLKAREDEQNPEQRDLIDEEVDHIEDQLRDLGVEITTTQEDTTNAAQS